jgi:hypothetical protein
LDLGSAGDGLEPFFGAVISFLVPPGSVVSCWLWQVGGVGSPFGAAAMFQGGYAGSDVWFVLPGFFSPFLSFY